MTEALSHAEALWLRIARRLGLAVAVIAIAAKLGWALDVAVLRGVWPGLATMRPETSTALTLQGLALMYLARPRPGRVARRAARAMALLSIGVVVADLLDRLPGIRVPVVTPVPMSPMVSVALAFAGAALATIRGRIARGLLGSWLALSAGTLALLSVTGYFYGVHELFAPSSPAVMRPLTAITMTLLSIGLVLAEPRGGLMRLLTSSSLGGTMARRLLPPVILVPVALGWLRLEGQRVGLFDTDLGMALFTVVAAVSLASLMCWAALGIGRIDEQREHARAAQAQSERDLAITLDSIGDAVIATDTAGAVTRMNPVAEALTGWSVAEARGRPLAELLEIVDATGEPIPDPVARAMRERAVVAAPDRLLRLTRRERELPIADSVAPVISEQGELRGAVVVIRDQSAQRELEAQLLVADRMSAIGMLASGIAHEINNPLAAVMLNVDLATRAIARVESAAAAPAMREARLDLAGAREAAQQVSRIVADLRGFARSDRERREPVDVIEALEAAARLAQPELRHRVRLERDLEPVPPVIASPSRLSQVFLNLIVNAAQAVGEGGPARHLVRLVARASGGRVLVEVLDSGPGLSAETQRRLFTPFFSTKPRGEGTGLGLAIAQRIVTELGGTVSAGNRREGGAWFRVELPAGEGTPAPAAAAAAGARAALRARIMIIDDERLLLAAVQRALSDEHDVVAYERAAPALAHLERDPDFDLILCDLMMPELSGMEFHERLTTSRPELVPRVIYMSGGAVTARAREFVERTSNTVVAKPFDLEAVRALLAGRLAPDPG